MFHCGFCFAHFFFLDSNMTNTMFQSRLRIKSLHDGGILFYFYFTWFVESGERLPWGDSFNILLELNQK